MKQDLNAYLLRSDHDAADPGKSNIAKPEGPSYAERHGPGDGRDRAQRPHATATLRRRQRRGAFVMAGELGLKLTALLRQGPLEP